MLQRLKQGTPEAVVARLHQALVETLQDAQVVSGLEATGAEVAKPSSVADSQRFLQTETGKFRAMAKRSSVVPMNPPVITAGALVTPAARPAPTAIGMRGVRCGSGTSAHRISAMTAPAGGNAMNHA